MSVAYLNWTEESDSNVHSVRLNLYDTPCGRDFDIGPVGGCAEFFTKQLEMLSIDHYTEIPWNALTILYVNTCEEEEQIAHLFRTPMLGPFLVRIHHVAVKIRRSDSEWYCRYRICQVLSQYEGNRERKNCEGLSKAEHGDQAVK